MDYLNTTDKLLTTSSLQGTCWVQGGGKEGAGGAGQDASPALKMLRMKRRSNQCEQVAVNKAAFKNLKRYRLNVYWETQRRFYFVCRDKIPEGFQEEVTFELGLWKTKRISTLGGGGKGA